MKKIFLGLLLLSLTGCEGSTAKGFWGESVEHPLCTYYGNCDRGGADSPPAPATPEDHGAGSNDVKSCELYGNCE